MTDAVTGPQWPSQASPQLAFLTDHLGVLDDVPPSFRRQSDDAT